MLGPLGSGALTVWDRWGTVMDDNRFIIASAVLFDTSGQANRAQLLHTIASGIQGDGLKIKRIAIFENPFIARVYVENVADTQNLRPWFLRMFKAKPDLDNYDFIVRICLKDVPTSCLDTAYSIESVCYIPPEKASLQTQGPLMSAHVTQSISESIFASIKRASMHIAPHSMTRVCS